MVQTIKLSINLYLCPSYPRIKGVINTNIQTRKYYSILITYNNLAHAII